MINITITKHGEHDFTITQDPKSQLSYSTYYYKGKINLNYCSGYVSTHKTVESAIKKACSEIIDNRNLEVL